jgi:hypothetical protein
MTSTQLLRFQRARPFKPFRINLADGRSLRISHPEMMLHVRNSRVAAIWLPREDAVEIVDLPLMTGLEPAQRGGNGRRRRTTH